MQRRVLPVDVADVVAERLNDGQRVHRLPEEVARIEVDAEVCAELARAPERLDVVDVRARVQLEADHELWMLLPGEPRELAPVGRDSFPPLPVRDALEVRQPAPCREMRRDPV